MYRYFLVATLALCCTNVAAQTPPIVITQQPVGSTVCEGVTATLTTAATGNASITYRWQRITNFDPVTYTDLNNGSGISGATTASLSINTTGNVGGGFYRCRISGTFASDAFTNTVVIGINTRPTAPSVTGSSSCGAGTVTLSAAGGSAGQYRWYTTATGGSPIAGQTSNAYTTPNLTTTTTYYAAINNGTCESNRNAVIATINTIPAAPTTTGNSSCVAASINLNAAGGAAGQYRWYTVSTGGTPITGQTNGTYATPIISSTTTYYVAINNGTCQSNRTAVVATINTTPAAPATNGNSRCGSGTVVLSATGGTTGQYRWYTTATGGSPIAGQTSGAYTPSLTATTTYYVALNNGSCEGTRRAVTATINTPPAAPATTGSSTCVAASVTLSASGGAAGQYRWYTVASGGTAIAGQTNNTYTTPILSITTTFYVAINNGTCESSRTPVVATLNDPSCNNSPPDIESVPLSIQIEGMLIINLVSLISDSDNNVDLSTLKITSHPSSGANATLDKSFNLIIDYGGNPFSGFENITIQVCDIFNACVEKSFSIEVFGDIEVFTGLSPNNDGKNDFFLIQHIEKLQSTRKNKVAIYSRWGDLVWEGSDYDNSNVVFNGKSKNNNDLPSGTYFYKIEFSGGKKTISGYLSLKR